MWVQDYCANCDKQCVQGQIYCSEDCRVAETHDKLAVPENTPVERRGSRFLYDSPLLKPTQTAITTPPLSPLLMAAEEDKSDNFLNQTSTSYRKWLLTTH